MIRLGVLTDNPVLSDAETDWKLAVRALTVYATEYAVGGISPPNKCGLRLKNFQRKKCFACCRPVPVVECLLLNNFTLLGSFDM